MAVNFTNTRPTPYKAHCSPDEAQTLLREYKEMSASMEEATPIGTEMIERAIQELTTLIDDFGNGKAIYEARYPRIESSTDQTTEENNPLKNIELETNYPKRISIPEGFSEPDRLQLSQANYDDLQKDLPIGSIEPRMPSAFFNAYNLLCPRPDGFINNLGLADYYPESPFEGFTSPQAKNQQVQILYPKSTRLIPMPNNSELASINGSDGLQIAKPSAYDPVIWRQRGAGESLKYSIQELPESTRLNTLDLTKHPELVPTEEEQEYWKQALPLPDIVKQKIKESPKDLLTLLVSYLAIKDKETGLSNFRYQANANINSFLEEEKEHLALIISELKVGHCDILSWYLAALIRAEGRPAWVSRGLVSTDNGAAFQSAYVHSVVVTIDENNRIVQADPTQYLQHDLAYLPEEFPIAAFNTMKKNFSRAQTNKTRVKYLKEFKEVLQSTREAINSNPERKKRALNSLSSLSNYFSILMDLRGLSDIKAERKLKLQKVNFDLEREASKEYNLIDIIDLLPTYESGYIFLPNHAVGARNFAFTKDHYEVDKKPFYLETRLARENLVKAHRLAKQLLLPLYKSGAYGIFYESNFLKILHLLKGYLSDGAYPFRENTYVELDDLFQALEEIEPKLIKTNPNSPPRYQNFGVLASKINCSVDELIKHNFSDPFMSLLGGNRLLMQFDCAGSTDYQSLNLNDGSCSNKLEDGPEQDFSNMLTDYLYFNASFQEACINKEFRKIFLTKINKDETWFRRAAEVLFCNRKAKPTRTRTDNGVYKKYQPEFFYPYYLESDDQSRLIALFKDKLKKIDNNLNTGRVTEDTDLREYSSGDSIRTIDWKATARSDHVYVRKQPLITTGISTPLHVIIAVNDTVMSRLQVLELIRTLQEDIKKTNREVYLGFQGDNNYFVKLRRNLDPRIISQSLTTKSFEELTIGEDQLSYLDEKGKPFSNLLLVTNDYNRISALNYLYHGIRKANAHSIYLKESRYDVYPQIKKDWIDSEPSNIVNQ